MKSIDNLELNSSKHSCQKSSLASINIRSSKKVKTRDLINLSSLNYNNIVLLNLLQDFLQDSTINFTSNKQELLIKSFLLKVPYILSILGTNSRKSLSYILTSSLTISKVTIVIIPLVGLKQDILGRAQKYNIPYIIYKDSYTF